MGKATPHLKILVDVSLYWMVSGSLGGACTRQGGSSNVAAAARAAAATPCSCAEELESRCQAMDIVGRLEVAKTCFEQVLALGDACHNSELTKRQYLNLAGVALDARDLEAHLEYRRLAYETAPDPAGSSLAGEPIRARDCFVLGRLAPGEPTAPSVPAYLHTATEARLESNESEPDVEGGSADAASLLGGWQRAWLWMRRQLFIR